MSSAFEKSLVGRRHLLRHAPASVLTLALVLTSCANAPRPKPTAELPEEVAQLARELERLESTSDEGDVSPPESAPDPGLPILVLRSAAEELGSLLGAVDARSGGSLRGALLAVEEAREAYAGGSPDLEHLGRTTDALQRAEVELANASRESGPEITERVAAQQEALAAVAERMARTMLRRARAAGVDAAELAGAERSVAAADLELKEGHYPVAVGLFGDGLKKAANTVTFDVARFEDNIRDALAGQTVGHAFSIAFKGHLFEGGESAGLARTGADAPATPQSPSKEMHVASVSKPLTAIVILRLLEENGLTPDTAVAPFLPSDWDLGAGVESLTFADFLTHRSGFGQKGVGNSYASLRDGIAADVGPRSFAYNNANYGLMRVLTAGLLGHDFTDDVLFGPDAWTAAVFLIHAGSLYDSIGVEVDCRSSDPVPTVQYNFPDGGASGYLEPSRQRTCGGFGWFISSNELASVMTHLRNTHKLLSTTARFAMQKDFLGFMDPANYGFIGGDFGVYYMHGGDWSNGPGELHSCAVAFPIQVEVGLVINSERGSIPYQCALLQTAFDDAWVVKS